MSQVVPSLRWLLAISLLAALVLTACGDSSSEVGPRREFSPGPTATVAADLTPPEVATQGFVVRAIPARADVIISSVRHVLGQIDCLDEQGLIEQDFISDPECRARIYAADGGLLPLPQLFALDVESGAATQLTSLPCIFASGQAVNAWVLVANAACDNVDEDGVVGERDEFELYVVDLDGRELRCLTCDLELEGGGDGDYSKVRAEIVFSARDAAAGEGSHLFAIDLAGNLRQVTSEAGFVEFGGSWSADGEAIVFSRRAVGSDAGAAEVWAVAADGSGARRVGAATEGASGEMAIGLLPIESAAAAGFSPDGQRVVFSRLRSATGNAPFGVTDLVISDAAGGSEELLDYTHANLLPDWGPEGILLVRQSSGADAESVSQALQLYRNGVFIPLESFPYDVYPLGAFGGSWISWR
jgi:WD40 repeat protein